MLIIKIKRQNRKNKILCLKLKISTGKRRGIIDAYGIYAHPLVAA
jgi:hypothetical protein